MKLNKTFRQRIDLVEKYQREVELKDMMQKLCEPGDDDDHFFPANSLNHLPTIPTYL
jgi:hypothetical protein